MKNIVFVVLICIFTMSNSFAADPWKKYREIKRFMNRPMYPSYGLVKDIYSVQGIYNQDKGFPGIDLDQVKEILDQYAHTTRDNEYRERMAKAIQRASRHKSAVIFNFLYGSGAGQLVSITLSVKPEKNIIVLRSTDFGSGKKIGHFAQTKLEIPLKVSEIKKIGDLETGTQGQIRQSEELAVMLTKLKQATDEKNKKSWRNTDKCRIEPTLAFVPGVKRGSKPKYRMEKWKLLDGDCSNGFVHGYGVAKVKVRRVEGGIADRFYVGHFNNGRFQGKGILDLGTGKIYSGEFVDGLRIGRGVMYVLDNVKSVWKSRMVITSENGYVRRYIGQWGHPANNQGRLSRSI